MSVGRFRDFRLVVEEWVNHPQVLNQAVVERPETSGHTSLSTLQHAEAASDVMRIPDWDAQLVVAGRTAHSVARRNGHHRVITVASTNQVVAALVNLDGCHHRSADSLLNVKLLFFIRPTNAQAPVERSVKCLNECRWSCQSASENEKGDSPCERIP